MVITRFYTKGRPLVKSNLICPSDKLSWQHGCPVLNINIQGNFCISQGNGSSDNLPENLVCYQYSVHRKCTRMCWSSSCWMLVQVMDWCLETTRHCLNGLLLTKIYDAIWATIKYSIELTQLPLDKMAAILQTIFSGAFSWMKSFVFWLKFHQSLFLRVQLTIFQHWFR